MLNSLALQSTLINHPKIVFVQHKKFYVSKKCRILHPCPCVLVVLLLPHYVVYAGHKSNQIKLKV